MTAAVDCMEMDTPHGVLYPPASWPVQLFAFAGALAGGPCVGYLIAVGTGVPDGWGRLTCMAAFFVIYLLGYALWIARLKAIIAAAFGGTMLRMLLMLAWHAFRRREPDEAVRDRLKAMVPDRGALQKVMVQAQKAASSFAWVSLPVGLAAAAAVVLAPGAASPLLSGMLLLGACVGYGLAVARLGRRGCLPMAAEVEA